MFVEQPLALPGSTNYQYIKREKEEMEGGKQTDRQAHLSYGAAYSGVSRRRPLQYTHLISEHGAEHRLTGTLANRDTGPVE